MSIYCSIDSLNFDGLNPQFVDSAGGDFHLSRNFAPDRFRYVLPPQPDSVDYDGFPRYTGPIDVGPYERTSCSMVVNFSSPGSACAGQPVVLTNLSTGHYTMSIWDYGNSVVDTFANVGVPAAAITPKTIYPATGNYTISVQLICPYDQPITLEKPITIIGAPQAAFQVDANQGCAPLTIRFTNTTSGLPRSDTWYFGDGELSTAANPTHVYDSAGVYFPKLISTNACGVDTVLDTITIRGTPVARISADVTSGSAVLWVNFVGSATENPTGWLWDFGDSSRATTQVASHNYSKPGLFSVRLIANNTCGVGSAEIMKDFITVYGFELQPVSADTANRFQQKFKARIDTLYGLFDRNIIMSAEVTPAPTRGTITFGLSDSVAKVLDTVTATAHLSTDVPAQSYTMRLIGRSVSNEPLDTVMWQLTSHPDTLIKLSTSHIDFDSVQLDTIAIDSIKVSNVAGLNPPLYLRVLRAVSSDTQFVLLDTKSDSIQPNGSFYIRVKFLPGSLGVKSAFVTITSDDPAVPVLTVTLRANVIPERKPPRVISISPVDSATGVLIGSRIDFNMSELLDPASVLSTSVVARSRKLHASIPGTVGLIDQIKITFAPLQRYSAYDTIDVRLLATVRDRVGNTLDGNYNGKGEGSPVDDYVTWFVTGPAVYPGDCNNDGEVNEKDILPLGIFFGLRGPQRDSLGEVTSWGPKQAVEWVDPRATYADADGNGAINEGDIRIIGQNWSNQQGEGSRLFPDDFDYGPYVAGLSALRSALSGMAGSESGARILRVLDQYTNERSAPAQYSLSQNRPNPFNPATVIEYALPQSEHVILTVHNILGQTVKVIVDDFQDAGFKRVIWDGADQSGREAASGVYFYKLVAGDFQQIRKMIKLQ